MDGSEQEVVSRVASPGRRSSAIAAFIAVGVPILIGAVVLGRGLFLRQPTGPELVVDKRHLDIGEVWTDAGFVWRLPIQNATDGPIHIQDFRVTCTCTRVEPRAMTIAPHSSEEIVLTINLADKHIRDPAKSRHKFDVTITPMSNSLYSKPPSWKVTGLAKDWITCEPVGLDLGEFLPRQPMPTRQIRLTELTPIQSLSAVADTPITAHVTKVESNGASYIVEASFESNLQPGDLKRTIWIEGLDKDGKPLPPVAVPVSAVALADVKVEPAAIVAGLQALGRDYEASLQLTSRVASPFELSIGQQDRGLELQEVNAATNHQQRTVRLLLAPQMRGDQQLSARITVIDPGTGNKTELAVPVYYYGTEPAAHN